MTDTPDVPITPNGDDADGRTARTKWPLIAGVLVIVAALVAALFVIGGDDDETDDSVTTSETSGTAPVSDSTVVVETAVETTDVPTSTESPVTTEVIEATTTTDVPPSFDDTRDAVWPWADTDLRYADPVDAATAFTTDYLGFTDPIVGEFLAGDSRSGEVEVRSFETGPATVVFVRQLTDDDSWWILGAASENITIDDPVQGAEITSPVTVSGTASAFEGTVNVELRADDNDEPIFEGFVTGSGGPDPGPFSDSFEFTSPGGTAGALVMLTFSAEDGSVLEASALRVFYR